VNAEFNHKSNVTSWETLDTPITYVRYVEQCLSQ